MYEHPDYEEVNPVEPYGLLLPAVVGVAAVFFMGAVIYTVYAAVSTNPDI